MPTSSAVLLVKGADICIGVAAEHRRVVPLEHNEVQAIGQRELRHPVLQLQPRLRAVCNRRGNV